jgi:hypothetical protein
MRKNSIIAARAFLTFSFSVWTTMPSATGV